MTATLFDDIQSITPLQPRLSPERARQRAIEQVTRAANQAFIEEAYRVIKEEIAPFYSEFSARTFWNVYDSKQRPQTRNGRALGGVFVRAANAGLIEATGKYEKSGRVSDHNQNLALWTSLVYRG